MTTKFRILFSLGQKDSFNGRRLSRDSGEIILVGLWVHVCFTFLYILCRVIYL